MAIAKRHIYEEKHLENRCFSTFMVILNDLQDNLYSVFFLIPAFLRSGLFYIPFYIFKGKSSNTIPGDFMKFKLSLWGFAAGLCNGLFGSGGGIVAVPVLERVAHLPTKKAHATAIALILPVTVVSIVRYSFFLDAHIPTLGAACTGGVAGSFIGAYLLKRFSVNIIRKIFGVVIIIAAVRMVIM